MKLRSLPRIALLACGLLLAAACSAHNDGTTSATAAPAASRAAPSLYTEGTQYITFKRTAQDPVPTGPVVLLEVFSYGCPHCAEFASFMDKLRGELPKGAQVRYKPAVFSPAWVPYAQAFYAAEKLGVLDKTHDKLFQAMLDHYPLNSLEDLADFYARQGVDRKQFMAVATSADTTKQMNADLQLEFAWGVNSTPTLVVGRLANTSPGAPFVALKRSNDITSYAQLQQVGLWLVQQVDAGHP